MSIAENKEIIQAFYDAGNRGDTKGLLDRLADDVIWTNIGTTKYSGSFAGKAELTERLMGPLFGQLKAGIFATVHNMIAEGEVVAVQLSGQAETTDGRPYNNMYCHVFRIRDGQIAEVTEYMDTELVTSVLGGV